MENEQYIFPSAQYEKTKEWRRKPWKLIEDMYGIKLHWWQKLKLIYLGAIGRYKDPYRVIRKY
jgi:hypothetical protein